MKHLFVVLAVLPFVLSHAPGQDREDAAFELRAQKGIDYVYNLEFESAESVFRDLVRERPMDPAGHFFLAMVDWWRIMIDFEDTRYDERFLDSLDAVIDLCDELLDEDEGNVMALFFKGGALGFSGRLSFHRDNWFAAADAGRKALPLVTAASEADKENYDIYLGTGIYNYYAEVIPELYPMAKPLLLFIPPGDKAAGIAQLRMASDKGTYAHTEAKYFLMQLYYMHEKDYQKALALARALHTEYPNNMLFHRYVGRCYVSTGNFVQAEIVFEEVMRRTREQWTGYTVRVEREAEYYLGLCYMNSSRYDSAIRHLVKAGTMSESLDGDEPSGYRILSHLNLGKIYDLKLEREKAVKQYELVLDLKEYRDSHEQAESYLRRPFTR